MYSRKRFKLFFPFALLFVLLSSPDQLFGQAINDAAIDKEKAFVLNWLGSEESHENFGDISDSIWSFAELGFQEYRSSSLLASTLEQEGFTIEMGLAGMPTCFTATFGSGKPLIGILAEYDALPMISQEGRVPAQSPLIKGAPGHGCGHNAMGTASIAAAIAIKRAMKRYGIQGTIRVFGSPAEEILASRPYMVRAGLFEGVDAIIDTHWSQRFSTAYGVSGNALFSVLFSFEGKTAHGASPWGGRSALDAVEIMNISTNYLREHLFYTHRMHYVIPKGGEAPNVVPDHASVWYFLRNTDGRIEDMYQRVLKCAEGAALATGTELSEVRVLTAIHQFHGNKALAELFQSNIEYIGMPEWSEEDQAFARSIQKVMGRDTSGMPAEVNELKPPRDVFVGGASTDVGEVSLIAPTATIRFPGGVPGTIGHHWSNVACTNGPAAWKGLITGAKAMAASGIDLLTQPATLQKVRAEFEAYIKEHPYRSFLPEDATPPIDLNRELMDKWRPVMETLYDGLAD